MCEYCGCRAVTAIGDLTREHDHVDPAWDAVDAVRARVGCRLPDEQLKVGRT